MSLPTRRAVHPSLVTSSTVDWRARNRWADTDDASATDKITAGNMLEMRWRKKEEFAAPLSGVADGGRPATFTVVLALQRLHHRSHRAGSCGPATAQPVYARGAGNEARHRTWKAWPVVARP